MRVTRAWWLATSITAAGCGTDAGTERESHPIGEPDAAVESDGGVDVLRCEQDSECDDGLFCNGKERCLPAAVGANAHGCVAAAEACEAGETCLEQSDECIRCTDNDDNDRDGAKSMKCGGSDCDDGDGRRFPGNAEACDDHFDEDCDPSTYGVRDLDHDGYTDFRCANEGGAHGPDCNDGNPNVRPGVPEVCNTIDDNCNGDIDEGLLKALYVDNDHDEHGDRTADGGVPEPVMNCANEPGFAEEPDDCDGTNDRRHDKQLEICDGKDNDCDDVVDENPSAVPWYRDVDGDGFGNPLVVQVSCVPPGDGWELLKRDCNDADPEFSPAAAEICDGLDNNCNGRSDYRVARGNSEDDDLDGWADIDCYGVGGDCDDLDFGVHPEAHELCDMRDNDCDGQAETGMVDATWYLDADGDGYGKEAGSMESCGVQPGYVLRAGDCNDADPGLHPDRLDDCSTPHDQDDDCDGRRDEDEASEPFYLDRDEDGYGTGSPLFACTQPADYVPEQGDCAPDLDAVHPAAAESCTDGVDNDCDSYVDCDDVDCADQGCNVTRRLLVISGADQTAEVAAELGEPVRVRVVDLDGNPLSGQPVTLTSTGGSGTSSSNAGVPSGADGSATFAVRAGRLAGPDSVRISAPGARPLTVRLTVTEPPDGQLLTLVNASKSAGQSVFGGASAPAAPARVNYLAGIARAGDGTLYISDLGNARIHRVTVQGRLEHYAGDGAGVAIDDVSALASGVKPQSLAIDESDPDRPKLYFVDVGSSPLLRVIDLRTQLVTTIAGGGSAEWPDYGDGEAARAARLWAPTHLTLIGRTLYFIDNAKIRYVDLDSGIIDSLPVAENADPDLTYCGCAQGGCALAASPAGTLFVAARATGALVNEDGGFCSNQSPLAIFRLDAAGVPHHVAGRRDGFGSDGTAAVETTLPSDLVMRFDAAGHLYFAGSDFRVRRIDAATSVVTTVLGDGQYGLTGDYGVGPKRLAGVNALAFDGDHLLIADRDALRAVWSEGGRAVTTLTASLTAQVEASQTILSAASALRVEVRRPEGPASGVAVSFRCRERGGYPEQRRVATASNGRASTVPWLGRALGTYRFEAFVEDLEGRPMFAPLGVSVEGTEPEPGTVLPLVNRAREVDSFRVSGPAQRAQPGDPRGLALASDGTLYFTSTAHRVFKVTPEGEIVHVAGTGAGDSRGDGFAAVNASIDSPRAIALDEVRGRLYVSDNAGNRIRVIELATGTIDTFWYGLGGIISLSADPATGNLWVAKNTMQFSDGFWRVEADRSAASNLIPSLGTANGPINAFMGCSNNCAAVYKAPGQLFLAGMIGGPAFSGPSREPSTGIAIYVEDSPNSNLLLAAGSGVIPSNAGADGPAFDVRLDAVRGIALHGDDVYFAESGGNRVRRLRAGTVQTVLGGGTGGDFVPALSSSLDQPEGLVVTPDGHLIVADTGHHEIRIVW